MRGSIALASVAIDRVLTGHDIALRRMSHVRVVWLFACMILQHMLQDDTNLLQLAFCQHAA